MGQMFPNWAQQTPDVTPTLWTMQIHATASYKNALEHGASAYCNLWGTVTVSFLQLRRARQKTKKKI